MIIQKCLSIQAVHSTIREQRLSLYLLDESLTHGCHERGHLNSLQSRIMTAECGLDKLQKHKRMSCRDMRFSLMWPKRQSKAFI